MTKFLYLAAVYFVIGLSLAHHGNDHPWYYGVVRPFLTPTSICSNNATAPLYLIKTLALINNLQANATYSPVLQLESPNFVSYLKNATNQALVYTNCTAFVAGVKTAKLADIAAERVREHIAQYIENQIRQIPHNVTGSNGPNEFDAIERYEHHHSIC